MFNRKSKTRGPAGADTVAANPWPQDRTLPVELLAFTYDGLAAEDVLRSIEPLARSRLMVFDANRWLNQTQARDDGHRLPVLVVNAVTGFGAEHAFWLRLIKFLAYDEVLIIVEKFDEIDFDREQFELVRDEVRDVAREYALNIVSVIPAPFDPSVMQSWIAREVAVSPRPSRLQTSELQVSDDVRFLVMQSSAEQNHWRADGRLFSGQICTGEELLASPTNSRARVAGVLPGKGENGGADLTLSFADPFFPEPGEVLSACAKAPLLSDVFCARVFWRGQNVLSGDKVPVRFWFGERMMTVQTVSYALNAEELTVARDGTLGESVFAELVLRSDMLLPVDAYVDHSVCGRVEIQDPSGLWSDGFIVMEGYADQRRLISMKPDNLTPVSHSIALSERQARNGHKGGVLWFTGLSGAGKSTLAVALEKRLFDLGYQVFVLDGDNIRQGLTANLGFSPDDRAENIRRVGEVAALFREAGTIVISSFISPYRSDRGRARHAAHPDFHEIFIDADVETCIARDPKGLYKKALKGDIRDFTGISAPYEAPVAPELTINTEKYAVEQCLDRLVNYVETHFRL